MLESFRLTPALLATSILFIIETTFSRPLTAGPEYSLVPSSDTDKLICYMQTADGRALNLDSLCRKKLSTQSQINIIELKYEDGQMIGLVVNNTSKTVYDAKVNFEVLGENGSVIDKGIIYTEPQTLNPGQTATFKTFMPSGTNMKITSVE